LPAIGAGARVREGGDRPELGERAARGTGVIVKRHRQLLPHSPGARGGRISVSPDRPGGKPVTVLSGIAPKSMKIRIFLCSLSLPQTIKVAYWINIWLIYRNSIESSGIGNKRFISSETVYFGHDF
jgi:hypothetical protein